MAIRWQQNRWTTLIGVGLAAACSRGLTGDSGSCALADPSLAFQVHVAAMQEHVADRDAKHVNALGVATLEGVECLRHLQILNVESSPLSDLSPLAGHPTLETLLVGDGATLRDLEPLGTIPHLHNLMVSIRAARSNVSRSTTTSSETKRRRRSRHVCRAPFSGCAWGTERRTMCRSASSSSDEAHFALLCAPLAARGRHLVRRGSPNVSR